LIEILALQAVAWHSRGETGRALSAQEKALAIGEPEGYVRVFVEGGAPMADLLRQAAARARGTAAEYVNMLLRALRAAAPERGAVPSSSVSPALVEPLTEREREVLHLLGQGLSNREIAENLVITVNGVKKHTSNIYGKLAVHSRTQAVVRAQELGLL
jgi:LuxR family maltose regulon positive regulatory protein